jgi:iron complex outermembrane recepter protein
MQVFNQFRTNANTRHDGSCGVSRKRPLALLVGALAACVSLTSQADIKLEEVVVTAQKREQSLQDVPIAVTALSGAAMADAGIQNMTDISRQVPVLEVQSTTSAAATSFRIRRVGNLGNIPTFEPAVGVFIDGAFRSRSIFGASELFDIERIEILRGPQSTLYGKNTTAGVIGIYTRAPSEELSGGGELSVANIEGGAGDALSTNLKGGVSGPITDTLRASLSGSLASGDETMGEAVVGGGADSNDADRYSVRGQLSWDASDALNLRLIAGTVQEDNKQQTPDMYFDPNGQLAQVVLPLWQNGGVSDTCTSNDPHDRESCQLKAVTSKVDSSEVTLLGTYELANGWMINSVTSWDYSQFKGTADDVAQMMAPILKLHDTQESESWQQELRLNSAGGETVDWLGGVFWYTNEFKRGDDGDRPMFLSDTLSANPLVAFVNQRAFNAPIPVPAATPGQLGYNDTSLKTDYIGVFGQATWNISDTISVTGGLRWQQEEKDADIQQWVNDPSPSLISIALSPPAVSANGLNRDTDEVTWSLTPQWNVTEDAMLYVTAAHGFKSGGYNTGFGRLPIADREFKDEDIMHYEAGLKLEMLDGRMRLAASTFYTEFDDYQDAAFVGAQFTVGNAEKAELKGAELEGTVLLTDTLTADFAVSYADFTYDKNTAGQCYPGRTPDSPTDPSACDLSGEHPVNAPEWKTHLGLQYDTPVSWGDVYARADWSWTDEYNTSFSADPRLVQDAYSWVNLRAGTRWDAYELVLWVDNATDETVANIEAVVNVYATATDGSYQSFLQAPRSYGMTFRANF